MQIWMSSYIIMNTKITSSIRIWIWILETRLASCNWSRISYTCIHTYIVSIYIHPADNSGSIIHFRMHYSDFKASFCTEVSLCRNRNWFVPCDLNRLNYIIHMTSEFVCNNERKMSKWQTWTLSHDSITHHHQQTHTIHRRSQIY